MKHITWLRDILLLLFVVLILHIVSTHIADNVPDQTSYLEWGNKDYAQVACYTSKADGFTKDEIMKFEYELHKDQKENPLWTDCYSGQGNLSVSNGNTTVDGKAYGVGGNFFVFHPLKLLSGSYIDTENVMKDYILLDEEAAWQLFGSNNVEGLSVTINGEPLVVAGVFQRPDNRFNNASGNDQITYYVCYEALEKYDELAAITSYEVIMANPVKHYARDYITKSFLSDPEDENKDVIRDMHIIEISDRYSLSFKWNRLKNFGNNAMDLDEIIYPHWENIARAYGDVLTLIFFLEILVITMIIIRLIPCIIQMIRFIKREKIADKGKIFIISKIGKTKEKLLDRFRTK